MSKAKKVFPVHLGERERSILEDISERKKISQAEVVRRLIRYISFELFDELDEREQRKRGHGPSTMAAVPIPLGEEAAAH